MKDKLMRGQLSIRSSAIHGYGVFAEQDFLIGDVIEECYALELKGKDELRDYVFNTAGKIGLLLGFGSLYNHAAEPNASYAFYPEYSTMIFTARKPILQGEEIVIYYGDDWFSSRDAKVIEPSLWFKWRQNKPFFLLWVRFGIVVASLLVLLKLFSIT